MVLFCLYEQVYEWCCFVCMNRYMNGDWFVCMNRYMNGDWFVCMNRYMNGAGLSV